MRKQHIIALTLVSVILFSGCSSDKDITREEYNSIIERLDNIEFQISNKNEYNNYSIEEIIKQRQDMEEVVRQYNEYIKQQHETSEDGTGDESYTGASVNGYE